MKRFSDAIESYEKNLEGLKYTSIFKGTYISREKINCLKVFETAYRNLKTNSKISLPEKNGLENLFSIKDVHFILSDIVIDHSNLLESLTLKRKTLKIFRK